MKKMPTHLLSSRFSRNAFSFAVLIFSPFAFSDPNMGSGYDGATVESSRTSPPVRLHDSTNPVVQTQDGYYIPGDVNFPTQTHTYEEAESRRSTTYSPEVYGDDSEY